MVIQNLKQHISGGKLSEPTLRGTAYNAAYATGPEVSSGRKVRRKGYWIGPTYWLSQIWRWKVEEINSLVS
jgi:hypothetical protein